MSPQLTARFTKRFEGGPTIAIDGLHLSAEGGITVLFGASGSGKTTVLRALAGLERPQAGAIHFGDEVWLDTERRLFLPARLRRVGFVPQDYALFPHLTVEANVGYGLFRLPVSERERDVAEILNWLGLTGLERRLPRQLSGGQQQRVALARAVVGRPRLLLLDEPLSALDAPTRQRLRTELRIWLRHFGLTTVVVTHDRLEALALSDRLAILHEGRLVQQGPSREVFGRPANLAAAGILAIETIQPGRLLGCDDGIATVMVNGVKVRALAKDPSPIGSEVFVCIRAEDVSIVTGAEPRSSPRNHLRATVTHLGMEGPLVRVELDCGFPLTALLTRPGSEELGLRPGHAVFALVKAPQVHLIPRPD